MKLSTSFFLFYSIGQAAAQWLEPQRLGPDEDQDSQLRPSELYAPPFLSSFLDELNVDRSFSSLSSIFDDMAQRQNWFLAPFRNINSADLETFPAHSFLRGRSAFPSSLTFSQLSDVDIINDEEKFQLSFPLPRGITAQDVHVEVQDGGTRLHIEGETKSSNERDDENGKKVASFRQYTSNSFTRTFSLDPRVEVDQLVATFKDGMLTVSAPKDDRRLRNLNHRIPVQDLDAITKSVTFHELTSSKHNNFKSPHFLHKSLPFVDHTPVEASYAERPITDEAPLPSVESRTDGWKDVYDSSL